MGHIRIAEDGPEGYGKRGSWEGYCSGGGISRMYAEMPFGGLQQGADPERDPPPQGVVLVQPAEAWVQ
ncbi:hypothetical protein FACS1894161_4540 [Spirochaetia bacterium]|nr:hypothetical protein FACS1894161_4540 [Spirochaetia bacterium]